jgi:hypothetical protein
MKFNGTTLAAAAIAGSLMLPLAASAHDGLDLKAKGGLGAFLGHSGFNASTTVAVHHDGDRDNDNDGDRHEGKTLNATSSAKVGATITRQGTRLLNKADFLSSLSPSLAAKIASSSASASTSVTLSQYNTALTSAKGNAQAAITLGGTIASSTGTSTLDLAAQARADLKAAHDFLQQAQQALINIVHTLWGVAVHI